MINLNYPNTLYTVGMKTTISHLAGGRFVSEPPLSFDNHPQIHYSHIPLTHPSPHIGSRMRPNNKVIIPFSRGGLQIRSHAKEKVQDDTQRNRDIILSMETFAWHNVTYGLRH